MSITRSIRTPIMHRAVEANGFVFVGGTIADDPSVSMGDQTRNVLGRLLALLVVSRDEAFLQDATRQWRDHLIPPGGSCWQSFKNPTLCPQCVGWNE